MVKKLAIDWDNEELRLVAAQCGGRSITVTNASVIPVENGDVNETLRRALTARGLEPLPTLVAIGRGRAELRELQLPPVPDEELPDMVRFQAIRSFATAGESATVDFLVTKRTETGVEMIAAAVGPANLSAIRDTCQSVNLPLERIALRPLAASALYLIHRTPSKEGDTVLIDLLADDAEIVVTREGRVIFVRTVRMPSSEAARGRALAGELRRSLVACGSSGSLDRVILWGRDSAYSDEVLMLKEASGSRVEVVDPFELVQVDRGVVLPEHVGRLAPLVGLLAADESEGHRLIDFLNPRERHVDKPNPYRRALLIGVPVAAALLLAFTAYRRIAGLDQQIASLRAANAAIKPEVDRAKASLARTETIDQFLDGDVNWLDEIRRMATKMPPSDQMIVRGISGTSNPRGGGGTLQVEGGVVNPAVIDAFEQAVRDSLHQVKGTGAGEQKTDDAYRWGFTESISVAGSSIRNQRYADMSAPPSVMQEEAAANAIEAGPGESVAPTAAADGGSVSTTGEATANATGETPPNPTGEMTSVPASEAPVNTTSEAPVSTTGETPVSTTSEGTANTTESAPEVQP